jgi:hypothetical protein
MHRPPPTRAHPALFWLWICCVPTLCLLLYLHWALFSVVVAVFVLRLWSSDLVARHMIGREEREREREREREGEKHRAATFICQPLDPWARCQWFPEQRSLRNHVEHGDSDVRRLHRVLSSAVWTVECSYTLCCAVFSVCLRAGAGGRWFRAYVLQWHTHITHITRTHAHPHAHAHPCCCAMHRCY